MIVPPTSQHSEHNDGFLTTTHHFPKQKPIRLCNGHGVFSAKYASTVYISIGLTFDFQGVSK